jgi:comEA protein
VREANNQDDVVSARLRAVLAATDHGVRDQQTSAPTATVPLGVPSGRPRALDFTDASPLKWSDIIPSWPDDVDLDPARDVGPAVDLGPPVDLGPAVDLDSAVGVGPAVGGGPAVEFGPAAGLGPDEQPVVGAPDLPVPLVSPLGAGATASASVPDEWDPLSPLESGSLLLEALGAEAHFPPAPRSPISPDAVSAAQDPPARAVTPHPAAPVWAEEPAQPEPAMPQWTYPEADDDSVTDPEPVLGGPGAFDSGRHGRKTVKAGGGRLIAFDPGRRGVKALAAVAVVVVLIAAVLAWRARPRVDPVAVPPVEISATAPDRSDGTAGAEPPAARPGSSTGAELVVAVGGKVHKPGLVRLPPGSRVADALQAAGGADPGIDVALLNLARKVVDGELIMVGVTPPPGAVPTGPAGAQAGGAGAPAGGPINLNTATLADLDRLPGVGPVLAQRILDARDAQGGFKAVSDLRKVDGIGDARYKQLKDLVVV